MENIVLVEKDGDYSAAKVSFGGETYAAVVGKNGVVNSSEKVEGDWKTPLGDFGILGIYYRPDKGGRPISGIPVHEISSDSIWVDEATSNLYNQPARIGGIEVGVSYEKMYRDDHLYDIFLDLDYNRTPAVSARGSAIFIHVARDEENPQNTPTAGCVALSKGDLSRIISKINKDTVISIKG